MTSTNAVMADGTTGPKVFSFTAAELNFNNRSVAASGTAIGNWINVAGLKRVTIIISTDQNVAFGLLAGAGGVRNTTSFHRYNNTQLTTTSAAAQSSGTYEITGDELAIMVINQSATNAANVTVTLIGVG
jgi:hypothetical protein